MKQEAGYGVVYTPNSLSDFVATLLVNECKNDSTIMETDGRITIVDPACGEGALLRAVENEVERLFCDKKFRLIGVDIEKDVIVKNNTHFHDKNYAFYNFNALLPTKKTTADKYWRNRFGDISLCIANPPWSSEKVFDKTQLKSAGFNFDEGQYDSYVLFIELCLKITRKDGYLAFIIPDSIFSGENQTLRKFLSSSTELRVIARLGEKIFPGVNRATTVMILKNSIPSKNAKTKCFRLTTEQRKAFLSGEADLLTPFNSSMHAVDQKRFRENTGYVFDIDTRQNEEILLKKLEKKPIDWSKIFHFGRGVEVAKSGSVVLCSKCGVSQGYSKKQAEAGSKKCPSCNSEVLISSSNIEKIIETTSRHGYEKIYVGENLRRYSIIGHNYIKMGVPGINYKDPKLYEPPKILVRKTGLGINASIDYESTYISQTVYSCNYIDSNFDIPLEYYLGVLNSRVLLYYYLKKYGENEWKSHPYITKDILFSLPVKAVSKENYALCKKIGEKVKQLQSSYSRQVDMEVESLVVSLYELSTNEMVIIRNTINSLPDLSAINNMKFRENE